MKLYKYTLLNQDGTEQDLGISRKKDFNEFYSILQCNLIEIIPSAYIIGSKRCTMYGDEEASYNTYNIRNPHFKVLKGDILDPEMEWDVVGDIIKEEVAK
jgi:hypothetical protein